MTEIEKFTRLIVKKINDYDPEISCDACIMENEEEYQTFISRTPYIQSYKICKKLGWEIIIQVFGKFSDIERGAEIILSTIKEADICKTNFKYVGKISI